MPAMRVRSRDLTSLLFVAGEPRGTHPLFSGRHSLEPWGCDHPNNTARIGLCCDDRSNHQGSGRQRLFQLGEIFLRFWVRHKLWDAECNSAFHSLFINDFRVNEDAAGGNGHNLITVQKGQRMGSDVRHLNPILKGNRSVHRTKPLRKWF